MSAVANLQLYPKGKLPAAKPTTRREKGTYGLMDNAVIQYQKRHGSADTRVLTTLAERHNFKFKDSAMTVAEIQVETGLGERAVQKALQALQALALCVKRGKAWLYRHAGLEAQSDEPNEQANGNANEKANERADFFNVFADLHNKKPLLKSLEVFRSYINNISYSDRAIPATVVAGGTNKPKQEAAEIQIADLPTIAPDGAASNEARQDNLTPSQVKNMTDTPENANVTEFETVPPAAPAADPIPAAYAALEAAGLHPVWLKWFEANPALARNRVALEAQICQFADWAAEGLAEDLRGNALDIVSAGTFAHPFNALKPRMQKAKAVRDAEKRNVADIQRSFGEAQCKEGERRIAPDGKVWTVEEVCYGQVVFEEADAPTGYFDCQVAAWEVAK